MAVQVHSVSSIGWAARLLPFVVVLAVVACGEWRDDGPWFRGSCHVNRGYVRVDGELTRVGDEYVRKVLAVTAYYRYGDQSVAGGAFRLRRAPRPFYGMNREEFYYCVVRRSEWSDLPLDVSRAGDLYGTTPGGVVYQLMPYDSRHWYLGAVRGQHTPLWQGSRVRELIF